MYNCLVLEDSLSDQLAIEMVLDQFQDLKATYVSKSKDFLREITRQKYNLYIIDIMLDESLTGIDLLQALDDENAWVIISSSFDSKDYYEQFKDFKFKKFYIKKPIDEFVFKTNIESFLFSMSGNENNQNTGIITVKQGNYVHKIAIEKINFIETNDHATTIFTENSKFTSYKPLKVYEEKLKNEGFEKVNRHTLVNFKAINKVNIRESYIEISNYRITISRNCKPLFIEKYLN